MGYGDLGDMRSLLQESKDFKTFIETPGISPGEKMSALAGISKGWSSPLSTNFLYLLVENKRLSLLRKMVDAFEEFYRAEKGIILCSVSSAGEININQKKS